MSRPKPRFPLKPIAFKEALPTREHFFLACQLQGTTASVVLRQAVREYLKAHPVPDDVLAAHLASIAVDQEDI